MNDPIQGEAYYNAYEKDIAVVNIFFGGSTVFGEEEETSYQMQFLIIPSIFIFIFHSSEFVRSQRMTWLDFISNLGGICGLCLGVSFISVIELVYWFTLRLFRRVFGRPG